MYLYDLFVFIKLEKKNIKMKIWELFIYILFFQNLHNMKELIE